MLTMNPIASSQGIKIKKQFAQRKKLDSNNR